MPFPWSASVAVTVPIAVWFSGAINLFAEVITGAVVSTTFTVLVTGVASFPDASLAVYVMVYVPTVLVSTDPDESTVAVPEASDTVAPASEYNDPSSTVTVASPVSVITGDVVSTTFTVLVAIPVLPDESVAEYVTVYVLQC